MNVFHCIKLFFTSFFQFLACLTFMFQEDYFLFREFLLSASLHGVHWRSRNPLLLSCFAVLATQSCSWVELEWSKLEAWHLFQWMIAVQDEKLERASNACHDIFVEEHGGTTKDKFWCASASSWSQPSGGIALRKRGVNMNMIVPTMCAIAALASIPARLSLGKYPDSM